MVRIIFQILDMGGGRDQKDSTYLDEALMLLKNHPEALQNCRIQWPEGRTVSSLVVV